jgi:3-hydroxymyristoyl/3-hydroxydecanoyl-(acyl carrier protein) dehydratase
MDDSNTTITGEAVFDMIPQKPPMVMIDKIISVSEIKSITALTVRRGNVFCKNGYFQAPGLSENIAQTAAAQVGYLAHLSGEAPPVGFIGAIKNLEIINLPAVGEELITQINVEHNIMNFTVINGLSKVGDKVMAKCQMKIFIADKEQV